MIQNVTFTLLPPSSQRGESKCPDVQSNLLDILEAPGQRRGSRREKRHTLKGTHNRRLQQEYF